MQKLASLADISNCDREPIHIPGAIQPHGFLLAVNPASGTIVSASENAEYYLGKPARELIGKKPGDVMDAASATRIAELLSIGGHSGNYDAQNPVRMQLEAATVDLVLSPAEGLVLLEFENCGETAAPISIQKIMASALSRIQAAASTSQLFVCIASLIREISDFDRVMIYRFHEDDHGEVVAEEKAAGLESFLHFHYPASDIPQQARELYKKNLVRLIADIEDTPSRLLGEAGSEPLDLTHSVLRAVSPVHVEYLRNMRVRSSFSISLIYKKQLWGLIACHNYILKPPPDYSSRMACRFVGQLFSGSLEYRMEADRKEEIARFSVAVQRLANQLLKTLDLSEALTNHRTNLLSINDASGCALCYDDVITLLGVTPEETQINQLIAKLRHGDISGIFSSPNITSFLPEGFSYAETVSGFLIAEITPKLKEYIIWFKPERVQTISWAGNPDKPVETVEDGSQRISPRKSFAKWQRDIRYQSAPWSPTEIQMAVQLREQVIQAINTKNRDIRTLNALLKDAYDELDTFTYTISHDLRAPLSSIRNYSELILEDYEGKIPADVILLLKKVVGRTEKMEQLISDVLHYSKVGRTGLLLQEVSMTQIMLDVAEQVRAGTRGKTARILFTDLLRAYADPTMMSQLFLNVIDNAVKYSTPGTAPIVQIDARPFEDKYILYTVRDNGIGFDMKDAENIFELFHRLDNARPYEGSGIGLAIVKRIVDRNQGRIWVESALNQGTTFYICLLKEDPQFNDHAQTNTDR